MCTTGDPLRSGPLAAVATALRPRRGACSRASRPTSGPAPQRHHGGDARRTLLRFAGLHASARVSDLVPAASSRQALPDREIPPAAPCPSRARALVRRSRRPSAARCAPERASAGEPRDRREVEPSEARMPSGTPCAVDRMRRVQDAVWADRAQSTEACRPAGLRGCRCRCGLRLRADARQVAAR